MGASREKQNRVNERATELSPKERAAQQAAQEKKKTDRRYTIGVVVVLVVALFAGLINSSLFDTKLTAVKTGDVSWSLADARYAKQTAYSQFYSNYSSIIDYIIDPDKPLDEQPSMFDESKTWDEYFADEGLTYLQQMAAYSKLAKDEGYTLTEAEQQTIEDNIAAFAQYAAMYGYSTDGYITAMYGEGNSAKSIRRLMELSLLAGDYSQDKQEAIGSAYTAEELESWYQDNAANYNKVSYLTAFVAAETDDEGNVSTEALAEAEKTAQTILDACDGTEMGFKAAVLTNTGSEATEGSSIPSGMGNAADWANDSARKAGDATLTEESDGYRLYCFLSVDTNEYNAVNVRHILVKTVDADEDGNISEEEKQTALDAITAIKDAWDGTEEGFAALANEKSEDPGSNTNGGLYENVTKGQMVSAFDEFCFARHKAGDNEIVYDDTYGYFFIYYVGEGDSYHHVMAKNAKTSEDFSAWEDELLEAYPIVKKGLFKKL